MATTSLPTNLTRVKISGTLLTTTTLLPVADANNIAGGIHTFETFADMQKFATTPTSYMTFWREGLLGYNADEDKYYKFIPIYNDKNDRISSGTWEEFKIGGGGIDENTADTIQKLQDKVNELWDIHYYKKPVNLSSSNVKITCTPNPAPFYAGRNTTFTYNWEVGNYQYDISSIKLDNSEILTEGPLAANTTTNGTIEISAPSHTTFNVGKKITVKTSYKDEKDNLPDVAEITVDFPVATPITCKYEWEQSNGLFNDSYIHGETPGSLPEEWTNVKEWTGNRIEHTIPANSSKYICFISTQKYNTFYVYTKSSGKQTAGGITYVNEINLTQYDHDVKYYLYRTTLKLGADNWIIECS